MLSQAATAAGARGAHITKGAPIMPITVVATDGIFSAAAEKIMFAELTASFLRHHDLAGNAFLTPNVIGEISTIPKGRSFAGGTSSDIVVIELKVPSFALASAGQKAGFIKEATEIAFKAAEGRHPRERIFVNMVYAVDGLWGIGGKAYTNAELGEAASRASAA
ncbi:4-oxalocrotonate tautomerase [Bradyrhizobium guangdongense]|uniref:4-oxalocrotonate tautomerase n=2 Tax=Bradyrhizobium guangdongense TaxID=1325090 RepID=A0ABX6U9K9_9BRAD|nr:4-oxalocrotonate tautomerase [Bradyrhizobium guangdongense]QOZ58006.1 4-oxalocrotonate tautomerase [Bradyrhizobium guangdongense]